MAPANSTALFGLVASTKKACIDYTPDWKRGTPSSYIDNVTFPKVISDKKYVYRVYRNGKDLGVKDGYTVGSDGSQKVNLLDYNGGYGIPDKEKIEIFLVDPDNSNQILVAQFN